MNILTQLAGVRFVKAAVFINNHFCHPGIATIYPNHVDFKNVALIL